MISDSNNIDTWKSFCEGDEKAFVTLYEKYYNIFFAWGCQWLNGEPDFVKDQLHDFFIYIWERRANLSVNIKVQAYLLTSFRRKLIYQWKKEKRTENEFFFSEAIEIDDSNLIEAEIFSAKFAKLEKALLLLTPAQREVIELRFIHNYTLQQIADQKSTTLRTVYNLLHRGLNKLKSEINEKKFLWLW